MDTAEPGWLVQRCISGPLETAKRDLQRCVDRLVGENVKMPLNVACSDVLRGLLTRAADRVEVAGHARFHNHDFDIKGVSVLLPQIALLRAALERALVELAPLTATADARSVLQSVESAQETLSVARRQLTVPERTFRFPHRFFSLGKHVPAGYCGELFACEEHKLVFNLHAYQDRDQSFVTTDSVSVKSTDPQLHEMWATLDAGVVPQLEQVVCRLKAVVASQK